MWALPWSPWASWSGQDKEPEEVEVKKETKAGGGQRSHRGVQYYQRNRSEEKSPIAGETAGMDKGKLKPPGGAKRASGNKQQGDGAELDDGWQVVDEKELQVITTCKCKGRNSPYLDTASPADLLYLCLGSHDFIIYRLWVAPRQQLQMKEEKWHI